MSERLATSLHLPTIMTSVGGVELFIVLSNQSGRQNLGTYLRTASAFGATQVVVVGSQRFGTHGAHRAQKYVDIVHFYELRDAVEYLKTKDCEIVGVSTTHTATASSAHTIDYRGSTAFMIDNEFSGLSEAQRAVCDRLVHVSFHGEQSAASLALTLDTTVVMAITLRHFVRFAQFAERAIETTSTQGKFVLDAYPTPDRVQAAAQSEQIAAQREAKRVAAEAAASEALDGDNLAGMFD